MLHLILSWLLVEVAVVMINLDHMVEEALVLVVLDLSQNLH